MVYDLLPFARPEWFSPKTVKYFGHWLGVVARRASLVLPISHSVQEDLAKYLTAYHGDRAPQIRSRVLPLSGDIGQLNRKPARNGDPVVQAMQLRPSVLMVGTIEPRKGHSIALSAHRHAWSNQPETAPFLIIAGKPGWHTEELQAGLRNLCLERDGAIWLEEVSDARLDQLYRACRCVLVASRGEGYCLPLHEALAYGKPVLARNLPVLRELHAPTVSYFTDDNPESLAKALIECVADRTPEPTGTHAEGWEETVRVILQALAEKTNG
ncbi:MAG: glycosyltransferase family 4 protein [Sphingomicrobium sp.]